MIELTQEQPLERLPDLDLTNAARMQVVCDDDGPVVLVYEEAA